MNGNCNHKASFTALLLGALTYGALAAVTPSVAFAQDDVTTEARARFKEGVALYDEGRYEAARAKFKQAYALKQHPDVLLNLGWSSLKSGHPQEAEESFSSYLRDAKDVSPAKRAEAEKGLAQAKAANPGGNSGSASAPPAGTGATGAAAVGSSSASPNATPSTTGTPAMPAAGSASASTPTPGTDAPTAPEGSGANAVEPIRVDALLGYTSDNVNVGIGIRGGKVVTTHVYVGGTLVYNFGSSFTVGTPAGSETVSTSAFYIGPEVGYEFLLAPNFILRPYGGLGFASFNASTSFSTPNAGSSTSTSDTRLLFWPGVTALYDVPNTNFMVGGDARLVFVPGSSVGYHGSAAFGIFATGGMRF